MSYKYFLIPAAGSSSIALMAPVAVPIPFSTASAIPSITYFDFSSNEIWIQVSLGNYFSLTYTKLDTDLTIYC